MIDYPVAHARPAQHAVDALGAPALEGVASGVSQPGAHDVTDLSALLGSEQVLPNDEALAVESRQVGLDDRLVARVSVALCPLVPMRQIAPEVLERCNGLVVDIHCYSSLSRCIPLPTLG